MLTIDVGDLLPPILALPNLMWGPLKSWGHPLPTVTIGWSEKQKIGTLKKGPLKPPAESEGSGD